MTVIAAPAVKKSEINILIGLQVLHGDFCVSPPRFLTVHPLGASATFVRLWKWQQRFMETARGNGKCSKIIKKTVCHALETIY